MSKKSKQAKKTAKPYGHRYVFLSLLAVILSFLYLGSRPFTLIELDGSLTNSPDNARTQNSETANNEGSKSIRPFKPDSTLYTPVTSTALNQYNLWATDAARASDRAAVKVLADTPTGVWLSGNDAIDTTKIDSNISAASADNTVPIFVYYNIPRLGCQNGGATDLADYMQWVDSITAKIATLDQAIVVLEPDAIPLIDCLNNDEEIDRYTALSHAVKVLGDAGIYTYIDAGHANWVSATAIASRIKKIENYQTAGFSLNVSNFGTTDDNIEFGNELSAAIGGNIRFVIDTSRNGLGPNAANDWCNPPGRSVGPSSQILSDDSLIDALLWIKVPGESDAACNGGPAEGRWWPEYAVSLIENRP